MAAGVIGIVACLWYCHVTSRLNYKDKHDAMYDAIATAHGWDPKHLSDDHDTTVEEETDSALSNVGIYDPDQQEEVEQREQ